MRIGKIAVGARLAPARPREIAEIERLMAERGPGNQVRRPDLEEWYRQMEPR